MTLDWQSRIAAVLSDTEGDFANRHLIAENSANGSTKIADANPHVSIFNFHYATPPDAVAANFDLHKPIGDDETGFRCSADSTYRGEGWEFLLAGGAVYDNLDYSFTVGHEAGTATPDAPGGGGRNLRRQLGVLKRFVESFDFVRMAPDASIVSGVGDARACPTCGCPLAAGCTVGPVAPIHFLPASTIAAIARLIGSASSGHPSTNRDSSGYSSRKSATQSAMRFSAVSEVIAASLVTDSALRFPKP